MLLVICFLKWFIFILLVNYLSSFLAVERADAIARQADIVAAMTLEVLKGTTQAFDSSMYAYCTTTCTLSNSEQ